MADPRFFQNKGPFTLKELAARGAGVLADDADPDLVISDIQPLKTAGAGDMSFLDNKRYLDAFVGCKAAAAVVAPSHAGRAPAGMSLILSERPYRSFAMIAHVFYEAIEAPARIHETAVIDPSAEIGSGCDIGPAAIVGPFAKIGDNVRLGPHAVVERGVHIGEGTQIGAHVSLQYCDIGRQTMIHPGVRIGQRGFGFDMDEDGFIDVPQLGRVIIGDGVEIGANSTIDRGAGPDTVIGDGSKIDNLVQLGHNVQLGRHCVLVAQSGVAGSSELADQVVLAAQVGISGHLKVGSGAQIGAQAGVMRDVRAGAKLVGSPAMPVREFFRMVSRMQKLGQSRNEKADR